MQFLQAVIFSVCVACAFGSCPAGWQEFQQKCYKVTEETEYWVQARMMCRMHDSDLIAIETQAEQDWFAAQAKKFNHTGEDQGFWLGATDWSNEGDWVWESNNKLPLTNFQLWGKGQPNNRLNAEHCLAAVLYFNYIWSDEYCDGLKLQYVCEKKFKNVAHSLEPVETPSYSASHQAPNYMQRS